jgi:hypothetical protein
MTIDVLIPTINDIDVSIIEKTVSIANNIFVNKSNNSAAYNRNRLLDKSSADIKIMIDDDISGFYCGWDSDLLGVMGINNIVSARLMTSGNSPAHMNCFDENKGLNDLQDDIIQIWPGETHIMPSSAFAFIDMGIRFDENYIGSGYEDTDFFRQYFVKYKTEFYVNNLCRLLHANEMKKQTENLKINRDYYNKKWGK